MQTPTNKLLNYILGIAIILVLVVVLQWFFSEVLDFQWMSLPLAVLGAYGLLLGRQQP